jgi:putative restriction endonuclease
MADVSQDLDAQMRSVAFEHLRQLTQLYDQLSSAHLSAGFQFNGERIPLVNPQRGIFKPRQMSFLLSIRTVFPRPGRRVWYDDQTEVHRQIFEGEETIDYAFMGQNPDAPDNRWLREAMENRIPIVYFLGTSPGEYQVVIPTYIVDWNPFALRAQIAFEDETHFVESLQETASNFGHAPERRYALREVKQRLHQASFRAAVIAAYDGRCALSGLPEQRLIDAAHIVEDRNEQLGQPIVQNGIPLSKIHHAAFDAHLIGIDQDFKLHISESLLAQNDGPMLSALKELHGGKLKLPTRKQDWPDQDRLATRFTQFRALS